MFSYSCPFCSQRLLAQPDRIGQRTICPKCLRPIVIPTESVAETESPYTDHGFEMPSTGVDVEHSLSSFAPITPPPQEMPRRPQPVPAPQPQPRAVPRAAPAPAPAHRRTIAAQPRNDVGRVMLHHPTGFASVDIAAELTAALTMRMKPPPDPPADLNLSTGGWLLMSVVGAFTWLVAIFSDERLLPFVAVLGTFLLAFGYFWAAYLAGLHNWVRGVVTLLPPVALWRICRPFGDNGYRPLRFVLTGALFLALYWVGPLASAALRPVWAMLEIARPERSNTVVISPAVRLKTAVQSNQPETVISLLADFASPDVIAATSTDEKTALIAEIKKLTRTDETDRYEVRVTAVNTLAMWSPKETRLAVLVALRSSESVERKNALKLAAQWPDLEMARAVANRLSNRAEETQAKEMLLLMPPSTVEAALLPLLKSDDQIFVLTVADLVEKIGAEDSIRVLTAMGKTFPNTTIRDEMTRHAESIRSRLTGSKPKP